MFGYPSRSNHIARPRHAVFGGWGMSSGAYSPGPGALFGQAGAMAPQGGRNIQAGGCNVPPPGCGPDYQLRAMYPNMPPLTSQAWQQVAACVACNAQGEADKRKTAFGVDSGAVLIAAAGAATITVSPQKRMIPERLYLTATQAANFLINSIDAGVESLLATTGAISAAIFIQNSELIALKSVVMDVGMTFSVAVTNIDVAAHRFTATATGKPVAAGVG